MRLTSVWSLVVFGLLLAGAEAEEGIAKRYQEAHHHRRGHHRKRNVCPKASSLISSIASLSVPESSAILNPSSIPGIVSTISSSAVPSTAISNPSSIRSIVSTISSSSPPISSSVVPSTSISNPSSIPSSRPACVPASSIVSGDFVQISGPYCGTPDLPLLGSQSYFFEGRYPDETVGGCAGFCQSLGDACVYFYFNGGANECFAYGAGATVLPPNNYPSVPPNPALCPPPPGIPGAPPGFHVPGYDVYQRVNSQDVCPEASSSISIVSSIPSLSTPISPISSIPSLSTVRVSSIPSSPAISSIASVSRPSSAISIPSSIIASSLPLCSGPSAPPSTPPSISYFQVIGEDCATPNLPLLASAGYSGGGTDRCANLCQSFGDACVYFYISNDGTACSVYGPGTTVLPPNNYPSVPPNPALCPLPPDVPPGILGNYFVYQRITYGAPPFHLAAPDFVSAINIPCTYSPDSSLILGSEGYGPQEEDAVEACAEYCESFGPECAYIELTSQVSHSSTCWAYSFKCLDVVNGRIKQTSLSIAEICNNPNGEVVWPSSTLLMRVNFCY